MVTINIHKMAKSVSGQHEANPAFWLATRAGKASRVFPALVAQEKVPSLFGKDGCMLASFFSACVIINLRFVLVNKNAERPHMLACRDQFHDDRFRFHYPNLKKD